MTYFKIQEANSTLVALEAIEQPTYVKLTPNNTIICCVEHDAQGVVSLDQSKIYNLLDKEPIPSAVHIAIKITESEYEELLSRGPDTTDQDQNEDPEDSTPEIHDSTNYVMTREELTKEVSALKDELAAAKILLGVDE